MKYKRIILKLSGEMLRNEGNVIDPTNLNHICTQIKEAHQTGVQIAVVIGGGNIFRGLVGEQTGTDRTTGDYMGMLSTMINGLAIMNALEKLGVQARVQSALPMNQVVEPFIPRRAIRHLDKGRVVIFVAGTGNPYFSTDTTAALRASELGADVIFKATKVDGIYTEDPFKSPKAIKYHTLSYITALQKRLNVMDSTAFSLCMDNHMPIILFNLATLGIITRALNGESVGTLVSETTDSFDRKETPLKDKHGTTIHSLDILQLTPANPTKSPKILPWIGQVVVTSRGFDIQYPFIHPESKKQCVGGVGLHYFDNKPEEVEIIGTMIANPELLPMY